MMFGGVDGANLVLNEVSSVPVGARMPTDRTPAQVLPEIQKLLLEGKNQAEQKGAR